MLGRLTWAAIPFNEPLPLLSGAVVVIVVLGVLALIVISIVLPATSTRRQHKIDYLGATLLAGFDVCVVLATSWGGTTYTWDSGVIIGLFVASALFVFGWWASERRAAVMSAWASLLFAAERLTLSPSASPAQPSRSASAMRARRLSRMSSSRPRWSGEILRSGHLTQLCSWMQLVP